MSKRKKDEMQKDLESIFGRETILAERKREKAAKGQTKKARGPRPEALVIIVPGDDRAAQVRVLTADTPRGFSGVPYRFYITKTNAAKLQKMLKHGLEKYTCQDCEVAKDANSRAARARKATEDAVRDAAEMSPDEEPARHAAGEAWLNSMDAPRPKGSPKRRRTKAAS